MEIMGNNMRKWQEELYIENKMNDDFSNELSPEHRKISGSVTFSRRQSEVNI
jgi:hypothetical protein